MKTLYYIIISIFVFLFTDCAGFNDENSKDCKETIKELKILYSFVDSYPPAYFVSKSDYLPERFLHSQKIATLAKSECFDEHFLDSIKFCLQHSDVVHDDSCRITSFNTDIVVLIEYASNRTDTLALSWDISSTFLLNNKPRINMKLNGTIINFLASNDSIAKNYIDGHYHKGEYRYCSKPTWSHFNKPVLPDYGCFFATKAEEIALGLCKEDSSAVLRAISNNAECVNFDSLCKMTTSCILFQQKDMLKILIENGADLESSDGFHGMSTPLMIACESPYYFECGKYLVQTGANVNAHRDGMCSTPLHICVASRNIIMADYLLSNGADIYQQNRYGQNAFDFALSRKYYKMAYLFLTYGYNSSTYKDKNNQEISIREHFDNNKDMLNEDIFYRDLILKKIHAEKPCTPVSG